MDIWLAGFITLVVGAIIVIITLLIISSQDAEAPATEVVPRLYFVRAIYFFGILAVAVIFFWMTISDTPYPETQAEAPDITVKVVGRMWSWQIDPPRDRRGGVQQEATGGPIVLPVGKVVEFQVAAGDVSHGFGIYTDDGQILAQVQAMPGYINRLSHKFDSTGTYHVLCMEYCGLAHQRMATTFRVE